MKLATKFMFMKMYAKAGVKKFEENAVTAKVKEYIQIDKGTMEGKIVATPIDPDTLSYK